MIDVAEYRHFLAFRDEFEALMDPACYSWEWLSGAIWRGEVQFRANADAAIAFEVKHYPMGATEVHGLCAAGDLAAIKGLIAQAEAWGREMGCTYASIASREGWARALASEGYEPYQVTIRKELSPWA